MSSLINQAFAVDEIDVPNIDPLFKYYIYNRGEQTVWEGEEGYETTSVRTLNINEINSLVNLIYPI